MARDILAALKHCGRTVPNSVTRPARRPPTEHRNAAACTVGPFGDPRGADDRILQSCTLITTASTHSTIRLSGAVWLISRNLVGLRHIDDRCASDRFLSDEERKRGRTPMGESPMPILANTVVQ